MIAFTRCTACALAALAVPVLAAGAAEAGHGVKPFYSETYETGSRPARGYEGFAFPDYYCSYKRYPKTDCRVDAQGKERCRVTGWQLEQTCQ